MNSYNLRELQDIYEGYKKEGREHKIDHQECSSVCIPFARIIGKLQALELLIRNKNGGSLIL